MKQKILEIGRILSTHALSGEVKFEHWGDDDTVALSVRHVFLDREGTRPLTVRKSRRGGKHLLLSFEEITDVDAANLLRGKTLYATREECGATETTVFWADLLGCTVRDAQTGKVYGKIRDIYNRGASDIWEIEQDGKVTLFPAADVFLRSTDPEDVRICPPEGLFL